MKLYTYSALLLSALCFQSESLAYDVYVHNTTPFKVRAYLKVKGVVGRYGKYRDIQPQTTVKLPDTIAYCVSSIHIEDARTAGSPESPLIPHYTYEVPWTKSCHATQIYELTALDDEPGKTEAYYQLYGRKRSFKLTLKKATVNSNVAQNELSTLNVINTTPKNK